MALIFASSSLPQPTGSVQLGPWDKAVHLSVYAVLGALVVRALAGGWNRRITAGMVAMTIVICTLYGISDEIHQYFVPPRQPDVRDVVADAGGSATAALLCFAWARAKTVAGERR